MFSTSDFRNGLKIELEGTPFEIIDFLHSKSGRGGAHVWTKLRNMLNGAVIEHTFRAGEKVGKPDLVTTQMQYLYTEGEHMVFMDLSSYEQLYVNRESLGGKGDYLKEGQELKVLTYQGQIIDVVLPASVELEVVDTEPGLKGDTVSGASKPARLESGLTVSVPLFIETGDTVKVDTRTGEYLGRA
jgi:elongation factor P